MPTLDNRLDNIEKKLDAISNTPSAVFESPVLSGSDEVDLRELFMILWQGKWWILIVTMLFSIAGVVYALSLPNLYSSKGVYAPAQKESGGGGIAGQFGGLAAMAGINIGGGGSNDIDQAIALVSSWPFLERVVNKHDLKPFVLGVKSWDPVSKELVWDDTVYDDVNKKWLRKAATGKNPEPSSYEIYNALKKMVTVQNDSKVNLLTIEVEHFSPTIAQRWVELLAAEINLHFKERDKNEAKRNIEYLQKQVAETSIAETHAVFYEMIEAQLKTLMLAEVGGEYLLKNVVEPKEAEMKSAPKRAVIVLFSTVAGGFLSVLFVFVRFFVGREA